jgi:peptidoglycan hydrolase CwlO-like protein
MFKSRKLLASTLVAFSVALALGGAHVCLAEDSGLGDLQAEADTLFARIEETTAAYQQAAAEVADVEARMAENEARIAEIEAALPAQRARTAACIKAFYKYEQSQGSLLSILLAAEDFEDFIQTLHYLSVIHEHNLNEIANLTSMNEELVQTKAQLTTQREGACKRAQEA